ncbi:hypothetical protein EMGBS8_10770 [Verrucomicrobiota bacterium]|nr:hypothetical protein EMGBS8_10770 [Verrucomicrobiota bacterium]
MSYNHRQAVVAAEDHVLQLGKLLEKGSLSDLIHPSHAKPDDRWRDADFVILRNESEEKESDDKYRKIYTPLAREVSGFMHRITDGAMTLVLKNTEYATFFDPAYQILADHMVKPRAKGPKSGAKSAPEPAWELLAMRAVISHALAWLKKVKPKAAQPELDGLVEERPSSFEEYLRRKAERGSLKKDAEKAAEELSKSMEELAAGVKGLADSGTHEMVYIAGIPGYQTQKAWFPQLSPFIRITEKQLEKVHKALVRSKLDTAPAMNQLYALFLAQCGHLGVDSKAPSAKVKPRRKS